MRELSTSFFECLLERSLRWLMRSTVADNQRYVVDCWNSFEHFNRARDEDDQLSFTSYAVFDRPWHFFKERRVRTVANATYQTLREYIGSEDSDRISIKYFKPSPDSPGYSAYIYMWAKNARKV